MIYEAKVLDNRDPLKCGRLYVFCPQLFSPDPNEWIYGASPVVGHGSGFFAMPEIGVNVLCTVATDTKGRKRIYWISGCWTNEGSTFESFAENSMAYGSNVPDASEVYDFNDSPDRHVWKTQLGHSVTLSDFVYLDRGEDATEDSTERLIQDNFIDVKTRGGKYLKLDDGTNPEDEGGPYDFIELSDETGNRVRIQTGTGTEDPPGTILMNTKNGYSIESQEGNTEISIDEGDGTIRIQHFDQGSVELDALTINIKGGTVNIEAGDGEDHDIECEHDLSAEVVGGSSSGSHSVTGTITCPVKKHPKVKINGSTAITI